MSELLGAPPGLDMHRWVEANNEQVYEILDKYWKGGKYKPDIDSTLVDINMRVLSEMPLCTASPLIQSELSPPPGYKLVPGAVAMKTYPWKDAPCVSDHAFFIGVNNQVIDFTIAQFVDGELEPGGRVDELVRLAPHLMRKFPNGLGVLIGDRNRVYEDLGIIYSGKQSDALIDLILSM